MLTNKQFLILITAILYTAAHIELDEALQIAQNLIEQVHAAPDSIQPVPQPKT